MTYHQSMDAHLNQLFDETENRKELLAPSSKAEIKALHVRVKKGDVLKPYRGMYSRKGYWDALRPNLKMRHVIKTYSRLHPELIFSHTSAAIMHGLEVNWDILWPMHVLTDKSKILYRGRYVVQHRAANLSGMLKDEVTVTSIEQTVVDCAATLPFGYALAIADSALHLGLTNKDRLRSYLESRANRRNVNRARQVISYADPRPDNGGESVVRAIMLECGLPEPDLQVCVENLDAPGHCYYVDFMFVRPDGEKVAVELDGKEKYENPEMTRGATIAEVMRRERRREALITSDGLRVARFSYEEAIDREKLLKKLAGYGVLPVKKNGKKLG